MNSKIKILIGILVIVILIAGGWWILNNLPEEIVESKYCEQDSDCVFTQCCGCASKCDIVCTERPKAVFCQCVDNQCIPKEIRGVRVMVAKAEYKQGEKVKITIKNNLEKSIYFDAGFVMPFTSIFIEGYKDEEWTDCDKLNCEVYGVAELPADYFPYTWKEGATKLMTGEEFNFDWETGEYADFTVAEKYRFRLAYYYDEITRETSWEEFDALENITYSNEFIIK